MKVFQGYKSIVFMLILTTFMSLGAEGCEEWWGNFCNYFFNENNKSDNENNKENENQDENQNISENNENQIDNITKYINEELENQQKTWTIFKITITKNMLLDIEYILDKIYIENETNEKNENEKNIKPENRNNIIESDDNLSENIEKKKLNAFIVAREDANKVVEMMKKILVMRI